MSDESQKPESSPKFYPADKASCCSVETQSAESSCCCSEGKESDKSCCKGKCGCCCDCSKAFAPLILRLTVGLITLMNGVTKFMGTKTTFVPDEEYGEKEIISKAFGTEFYDGNMQVFYNMFHDYLPDFMLKPFLAVLGYALLILGITTIIGLFKKTSLLLTAGIYLGLMFGLLLLKQEGGVSYLAIYLAMIAVYFALAKKDCIAVFKKF